MAKKGVTVSLLCAYIITFNVFVCVVWQREERGA